MIAAKTCADCGKPYNEPGAPGVCAAQHFVTPEEHEAGLAAKAARSEARRAKRAKRDAALRGGIVRAALKFWAASQTSDPVAKSDAEASLMAAIRDLKEYRP